MVAMPTAIPVVPLIRRNGSLAGRITGSFSLSSKFGTKSTRFLSSPVSRFIAPFESLASV